MKSIIITTLAVTVLALSLNAQTNVVNNTNTVPTISTNEIGKAEYGNYEVTLGGYGTTTKGHSEGGVDLSISTNPFKKLPQVWVGVAQSMYWEPSFGGSTDVFSDWNTHLFGQLYLNTGWSVGTVYGSGESTVYRTGPEASLEYYTSDNAFIYAGANYDFVSKGSSGLRYSFGIGIAF